MGRAADPSHFHRIISDRSFDLNDKQEFITLRIFVIPSYVEGTHPLIFIFFRNSYFITVKSFARTREFWYTFMRNFIAALPPWI